MGRARPLVGGAAIRLSLPPELESQEDTIAAHDEEMKTLKKHLDEERIKKVEAINKLAQVRPQLLRTCRH